MVHGVAPAATFVHRSSVTFTAPVVDDCVSLKSGGTLAAFLHSMESIMDLPQLYSLPDADDPLLTSSSFPFDVLNATVEDIADDDAWSDDESTSSLPCGDVCITDVVLPHTADQHLHLFPGPTDAAAIAIDLALMMSTNDVPPDLPVDPLYAFQHRCTSTKRSALHHYGKC